MALQLAIIFYLSLINLSVIFFLKMSVNCKKYYFQSEMMSSNVLFWLNGLSVYSSTQQRKPHWWQCKTQALNLCLYFKHILDNSSLFYFSVNLSSPIVHWSKITFCLFVSLMFSLSSFHFRPQLVYFLAVWIFEIFENKFVCFLNSTLCLFVVYFILSLYHCRET